MFPHKELSFLPWLGGKDIQIGNVIFWTFKPEEIGNELIRNHLIKLFTCYVDVTGQQVKPITIASYKNKNYMEELTREQYWEIKTARDILCFIAIAPQVRESVGRDNRSIVPPSAEIYQMVFQNFIPGVYDFAFQAGNTLSAGWTLDDIKFSKPLATGGIFNTPHPALQRAFNALIQLQEKDLTRTKILRAIEWFRMAHVENDEVSILSKVVMMSTAFEILLAFPREDKSGYFANKIDELIARKDFIYEERPYNKKGTKRKSRAGWWAWDFYKLRNDIVHGNQIEQPQLTYTSWFTHLIVADLILLKLIVKELEAIGCYTDADSYNDIYKLFDWIK